MFKVLTFFTLTIVQSAIVDNCIRYVTNPESQVSTCIECRDGFFIRMANCIECNRIIRNAQCSGFKTYSYGSNIVSSYSGASATLDPNKTSVSTTNLSLNSSNDNNSLKGIKLAEPTASAVDVVASAPKSNQTIASTVDQPMQNEVKNANNEATPVTNHDVNPGGSVSLSNLASSTEAKASSAPEAVPQNIVPIKPIQLVAVAKQTLPSVLSLENCKQIDAVSSTCIKCFGGYDIKIENSTGKMTCFKKQSQSSGQNKMNKCLVYSQMQNKCIMCEDDCVLVSDGMCKQAEAADNKNSKPQDPVVVKIVAESAPVVPEMNYVKADVISTLIKTQVQDKILPASDGQISMDPTTIEMVHPTTTLIVGNVLSNVSSNTNSTTLQPKKLLKLQLNQSQSAVSLPAVQTVNNSMLKPNPTLKIQVTIQDANANAPSSSYIIKASDFDPCAEHENKDDPKLCTKCLPGFMLNSLQNKCVNVSKSIVLTPKKNVTDVTHINRISAPAVSVLSTSLAQNSSTPVPHASNQPTTASTIAQSASTSTNTSINNNNNGTINNSGNPQAVASLSTTITITVSNSNPNNTIINISTNSSKPTLIETSGLGSSATADVSTVQAGSNSVIKPAIVNNGSVSPTVSTNGSTPLTQPTTSATVQSVSPAIATTFAQPTSIAQASSMSTTPPASLSAPINIATLALGNANTTTPPTVVPSSSPTPTKDEAALTISSAPTPTPTPTPTLAPTPTLSLSSSTPTLSSSLQIGSIVASPSMVNTVGPKLNSSANPVNVANISKNQTAPTNLAQAQAPSTAPVTLTPSAASVTPSTAPVTVTPSVNSSTTPVAPSTAPITSSTVQIPTVKTTNLTVSTVNNPTTAMAATISNTTASAGTLTAPSKLTSASTPAPTTNATNSSITKNSTMTTSNPIPTTTTSTSSTTSNGSTISNSSTTSASTAKPTPKIVKCIRYRDYTYAECTGCDTGYQLYQNKCYDIFSYRLLMKSKMLTATP